MSNSTLSTLLTDITTQVKLGFTYQQAIEITSRWYGSDLTKQVEIASYYLPIAD